MINRFKHYLEILDIELNQMFNEQAAFIKCKKGCCYCCQEGDFTMSELEYANLMLAYSELDSNTKGEINKNIDNLLSSKRAKYYSCPFLVNKECSVYTSRPLICRAYGLIFKTMNNRKKIPFCVDLGLNYADVYDSETSTLINNRASVSKPQIYNIDRTVLRRKEIEETFNIFFGEDKSMVDWLREDVKDE